MPATTHEPRQAVTCLGHLADDIVDAHGVQQRVVEVQHERQLLGRELPLDVLRVEFLCVAGSTRTSKR
jgi:hypothetical protein